MSRTHDDWDGNAAATDHGGGAHHQRQHRGDHTASKHGVNRTSRQHGGTVGTVTSRQHGVNVTSRQNGAETQRHRDRQHHNGVSHQNGGNGGASLEDGVRRRCRRRGRRVRHANDDNVNDDRHESLTPSGGTLEYEPDRRDGRDRGHDRRDTRSRSPVRRNLVKNEVPRDHDGSNDHLGPQSTNPSSKPNIVAEHRIGCYGNEHRHQITATTLECLFFWYWRSDPVRASEILEEELPANTRVSYGYLWYPGENGSRLLDDNDFFPCIGRRQGAQGNVDCYHLIGPTTHEFLFRRFLRINPLRAADLVTVMLPNRTPVNYRHDEIKREQQPAVGSNAPRPFAPSNVNDNRYEAEIVQCVREDERRRALQVGGDPVAGADKIGTLAGQNGRNAA